MDRLAHLERGPTRKDSYRLVEGRDRLLEARIYVGYYDVGALAVRLAEEGRARSGHYHAERAARAGHAGEGEYVPRNPAEVARYRENARIYGLLVAVDEVDDLTREAPVVAAVKRHEAVGSVLGLV